MPLPEPNKNKPESKNDFLSRCMENPTSNKDFPDNKQRYAVCNSIWSRRKKTAKATASLENGDEFLIAASDKNKGKSLNKPFRTPSGPKKFAVYTKNDKGNVVMVRFGDPNMEIKRDDPNRRKNFRARHSCDNPGPKWKARYWSCRMWEKGKSVSEITKGSLEQELEDWDGETFWEFEDLIANDPNLLNVSEASECEEGEEEEEGGDVKSIIFSKVNYLNEDLRKKVGQEANKKFGNKNSYVKNLWILREYKRKGGKVRNEGEKPSKKSIKDQISKSSTIDTEKENIQKEIKFLFSDEFKEIKESYQKIINASFDESVIDEIVFE